MNAKTPLYEAFFQKHADYYLEKVERYHSGQKVSFNAFACLFGLVWFLYRKMYLETLILIILIMMGGIIEDYLVANYFDESSGTLFGFGFTLATWAFTGFIANYLYVRKAERIIASALIKEKDMTKATSFIQKKGGTSYLFLLVFVAIVIAFFVYNNYMTGQ